MRVCLISPGHLSTNPRLVKEAQALSDAGYAVSIVCGRYQSWGWEQDQALIDPRWSVTHVPFGPAEAPRLTYMAQTVRRYAARSLVRTGVVAGSIDETAYRPIVPALRRAACSISADLYIAHYVAALPAAAEAAARHAALYAFDAEDFHPGDAPETPDTAFDRRLIHDIEKRYLPKASYLTAASPMIADAYAESYAIARPKVVLNVFPRRNAPLSPTPRGSAVPGPSVYWFSQTIGPDRGLETAIEAVARAAAAPHLYLRGVSTSGFDDTLRALARKYDVTDRLHILKPEPPSEMERLGAHYDLGFSGEPGFSRNNARALGNKLFSYLSGGLPIVASDVPSHRAIAPELGEAMTLFPIGDSAALAEAIDQHLLEPERLAAARAHAWRIGQERYCWEVEQHVLIEAVEGALSGGRSSAA